MLEALAEQKSEQFYQSLNRTEKRLVQKPVKNLRMNRKGVYVVRINNVGPRKIIKDPKGNFYKSREVQARIYYWRGRIQYEDRRVVCPIKEELFFQMVWLSKLLKDNNMKQPPLVVVWNTGEYLSVKSVRVAFISESKFFEMKDVFYDCTVGNLDRTLVPWLNGETSVNMQKFDNWYEKK